MYVNKCIKCGREFETKNPKRVICPDCLYPDKNMMIDSQGADAPIEQNSAHLQMRPNPHRNSIAVIQPEETMRTDVRLAYIIIRVVIIRLDTDLVKIITTIAREDTEIIVRADIIKADTGTIVKEVKDLIIITVNKADITGLITITDRNKADSITDVRKITDLIITDVRKITGTRLLSRC